MIDSALDPEFLITDASLVWEISGQAQGSYYWLCRLECYPKYHNVANALDLRGTISTSCDVYAGKYTCHNRRLSGFTILEHQVFGRCAVTFCYFIILAHAILSN